MIPPKKNHVLEASEEIGTCQIFFQAFGRCLFGGRLKPPRTPSFPDATAPGPPSPSVAAPPQATGWLNLPDERPQYEKFLDFLIPLGAIKNQWRQIKLVAKLYGVMQQSSQVMAARWQEIELMQPSFQALFVSLLQPKSPGCLAEASRI